LQDLWENAAPSAIYEEVSLFRVEKSGAPTPGSVKKKQQGRGAAAAATITRLVLIVSNWSFVRDHKDSKRPVKCTSQDVTISLKLSSTAFARTSEAAVKKEPYSFDKNGLILPYPAFLSLLKNEDFTDLMEKVTTRYTLDTSARGQESTKRSAKKAVEGKSAAAKAASARKRYAEAYPELADDQEEPEPAAAAAAAAAAGIAPKKRAKTSANDRDTEDDDHDDEEKDDDNDDVDDDEDDDDDDDEEDDDKVVRKKVKSAKPRRLSPTPPPAPPAPPPPARTQASGKQGRSRR
jgi:hypothetical protein